MFRARRSIHRPRRLRKKPDGTPAARAGSAPAPTTTTNFIAIWAFLRRAAAASTRRAHPSNPPSTRARGARRLSASPRSSSGWATRRDAIGRRGWTPRDRPLRTLRTLRTLPNWAPSSNRCAATSGTSTRTSRVCSSASTPLAALARPTRCDARRRRAKRRWTGRGSGAASSKSTPRRCEPRENRRLDVASPSPRSRARFVRRASPRRRRVGASASGRRGVAR